MTELRMAVAGLGLLALAGCGGAVGALDDGVAAGGDGSVAAPGMGMCAPGVTDCVDTVVVPQEPNSYDEVTARNLLGLPEAELPDDVRIGRRGEDTYPLTEDYVHGRATVELDPEDGTYVVTRVTVELSDGPQTFER